MPSVGAVQVLLEVVVDLGTVQSRGGGHVLISQHDMLSHGILHVCSCLLQEECIRPAAAQQVLVN
jgi:hypothetical protein